MLHFLTGFYFGGALATFLALIGGALVHPVARDNMLADPLGVIFIIVLWPYKLLKVIHNPHALILTRDKTCTAPQKHAHLGGTAYRLKPPHVEYAS